MLTVIKRLGHEEEFNINKIIHSMAAASDELRQPLCESDINNLASDIQRRVAGREKITARELFIVTIDTIRERGFTELARVYSESGESKWA